MELGMMGDRKKSSLWNSVTQKVSHLPQNLGRQASELGKNVTEKATENARKTATEMGDALGNRASEAKKAAYETAGTTVESAIKRAQNWVENIYPETDEEIPTNAVQDWSTDELYHIFLPSHLASFGGNQTVTVMAGKKYEVKIPPHCTEGTNLRLKGCGLQGKDAFLILHTLVTPSYNIDRKINSLVVQSPIHDRSKIRCLEAYNRLNSGLAADDPAALNLLDSLVFSSPLYSEIGQRYTIATYNSRLAAIENCLESTLAVSELDPAEQRALRVTYQYLRAGEVIPSFENLTGLDAIVLTSSLHLILKRYYLRTSAIAWVMAVDATIINSIYTSPTIAEENRQGFLSAYDRRRRGRDISDRGLLEAFETWIVRAELPEVCRSIYQLLRERPFESDDDWEGEDAHRSWEAIAAVEVAVRKHRPDITPLPIPERVEVRPGALAESAYETVSRGGLGLLSGIHEIGGVNTFIETAARVAVARVASLSPAEKLRSGIAHPDRDKGRAASAPTSHPARGQTWQAVGPLGNPENHPFRASSGVTAYRSLMAELDGVEALHRRPDGHPGLTTLNSGLDVRQLFKHQKNKQQTIKTLETQMYS
ncbi:MAG: hypothetical protein ACP5D7_04725 [Limnospira sp.]